MTERVVEPELLDELPASDPRAIESRRDLRRLNRLMGHARIIARALRSTPPPRRVVDLGAGDGELTLAVARQAGWRNVEVVLVDRAVLVTSRVEQGFTALHCRLEVVPRDVFDALGEIADADAIMANLFLHHCPREELTRLLALAAARCRVFVACEPRRTAFPLLASCLVGAVGCNAVTRHDAVASVRAGFRDREIAAHWPQDPSWSLTERATGLFSHLLLAVKNHGLRG